MTAADTRRDLHSLAQLRGVQLSYTGQDGRAVTATDETLAATLGALGYPAADAASITAELIRAQEDQTREALEPVVVQGRRGRLSAPIRLPRTAPASAYELLVHREGGGSDRVPMTPARSSAVDGGRVAMTAGMSSMALPPGYHRLTIEGPGVAAESMLLVPPPRPRPRRGLGVAAPLYAVRGKDDWGVGSYCDLAAFATVAASWGADLIGSLPLFATSTDSPIDPSPYLPISRLFWNELYVDVAGAAELAGCESASAVPPSAKVRNAPEVDYEAVVRAKRRALERCAESLAGAEGRRREEFETFVAGHPELVAYADFRAAGDRAVAHYHRFVQYAATMQLASVAATGGDLGVGLYLDLPVGVRGDGYDTWSRPGLFAAAEVGAPPDAFFDGGQAWGFPPLHPERLRADGYRYFIEILRHSMRFARAIRIDHILGLQRLYWIAPGADARSGAYVSYHHDELLAIVAIEAHRAGTLVVGEDLGTVSDEIRDAMDRHGVLHTFVYQFAAAPDEPFPQPDRPAMASVGNHDLPRFATYWREPKQRKLAAAVGTKAPAPALRSCLESLARGPASYLLVDVADLEGEVEPDNQPGTGPEAGNWRRRLPRPLDQLAADTGVRDLMTTLAAARSAAPKGAP
ncbi:MAG TPA: 4-alpha-glucanotransferase [Mycobacteriales bacterium]|nr:4-alpha-glucanotransferase [Mycobacteriales bacterium]